MIVNNFSRIPGLRGGLIASGILLAASLTGCISNPLGNAKVDFKTRITSTNLKQFELRVHRPDNGLSQTQEALQKSRRQSRQPARSGRDIRRTDYLETQMLARLDELIAQNQFCRDGYWVITTETYGDEPYVRGECNDTATQADRQHFPDTITYW